jgi:hypothetical protein
MSKPFGKVSCEYYDDSNKECRLLREQQMEEFWDKCRHDNWELLYNTSILWNKKLREKYNDLPVDDMEDIDFEKIINSLKKSRVENYKLTPWLAYVKKTVYREILKIWAKQGLMPDRKGCGSCKYLAKLKPYNCTKTGERKKKTDKACKEYLPEIGMFIPLSDDSDNDQEQDQEKNRLWLEIDETVNPYDTSFDIFLEITETLEARAENAMPGTKEKERRDRQYEIFIRLRHLLSKRISKKEAVKILTDEFKVSKKTIRRDIKEIESVNLKKMSFDG